MGDDIKPNDLSTDTTGRTMPHCPDFARAVREADVDESLLAQIVDCFAGRLTRFANYYCKDDNLGSDAFQEAMLATIGGLQGYRGDSPIEPWLRRIVMTSCSRLRRGKKNDPSVNVSMDDREGSLAFADSNPDQEIRLIMAQGLSMVNEEIEALDEPNRSLLKAHDIDETPIRELATSFEMSQEAVKSRLKRARATVRDRLVALT